MWITDPKKELWAGDESAYEHACELAARINATDPKAFMGMDDLTAPSLLAKNGDVGVIDITGTLYTAAPDWAKAIFGVTDYPQISEALVQAAKDPEIGSILLNVNSPGGAVSGVTAVAELVKRIDTQVKPVHAYTGNRMASAAYWIGSGAREISAGDVAEVGSVGVITMHTDVTKAEEKEGLTTTVLRAGTYKALANPHEALSPLARNDIQSKLDYTYQMFLSHVADNRGMAYAEADSSIGQGRTFLGKQGVTAGAVDAVRTAEQALTAAQEVARQTLDKRKSLNNNAKSQNEGKNMKKKALLTEQDIAAIASGVPLDVAAVVPPVEPQAAEPVADPLAPPVDDPGESEAESTITTDAAAPAAAEPAAVAGTDVVTLLQAQLREAQETLVQARVDLLKAQDKITEAAGEREALATSVTAMSAIVRDSAQKMYTALGQQANHLGTLEGAALLEEHGRVCAVFQEKFKVGGVAAAAAGTKTTTAKVPANPVQNARIRATRLDK